MMKFLTALFLSLALTSFGAVPDYRVFRGSGGILVTTNPPTGLIVIDGSGVFTSSGTNATISTSTNGVLVAVASTNINFIRGTNVVLTATNIGSVTHIGFHAVTPPEEKTISTKVNGTTISLVTTQLNMVEGINTVLAPGTNSPAGNVSVGFNLRPNLRFFPGANEMVLGSWGNVFGVSNAVTGDLSFYNSDPGAGDDWVFGGLISAVNANLSLLAGSGDLVAISPGGTLLRTNVTQELIVHAVTNVLLTLIIYIPELRSSNIVVTNIVSPNISAAPPISSVQYNSNGFIRGSSEFLFTNGVATVGQGVEVTTGSFVLNGGTTALVAWNGLGRIRWDSDGVMRLENDSASGFNRVNIGGNTAASPALGVTNGDFIILGGNGAFKAGDATNKLRAPAVYIANDGGMGTPLLRLENPLNAMTWDLAINSHPETYFLGLGRVSEDNYAMVWELGGNVGIGITNPTVRLDVQGRFMARSNVYFPNISSNATPVALLATDSDGQVYETAVPTGGGSSTPSPPMASIQFHRTGGIFGGTNLFVYDETNNRVGIGTGSPLYPLDIHAATGRQRIVSTTAANGSQLLFVNNSEGLIGLESSIAGTTVAGSSEYSLLVANQYAYPVQLATDNAVRMTVLPTSGNVGITTASPTNALDVSGHVSFRTNVFLPNLPTNGSPIAFLAVDGGGMVYETAAPSGGSGTVAAPLSSVQFNSNGVQQGSANFVYTNAGVGINTNVPAAGAALHVRAAVSGQNTLRLDDTNGTPRVQAGVWPASSDFGGIWLGNITPSSANYGIIGNGSTLVLNADTIQFNTGGSSRWAVNSAGSFVALTDDLYPIGASGANRPSAVHIAGGGAETLGLLLGSNTFIVTNDFVGIRTIAPTNSLDVNGHTSLRSNVFLPNLRTNGSPVALLATDAAGAVFETAITAGSFSVSGNSNQIPYLNMAGTGFLFGATNRNNPGFGFSKAPNEHNGALMIHEDETNVYSLVAIGHPTLGSSIPFFCPSLTISNRYSYSGSGNKVTQEMVRVTFVDITDGTDPESFIQTWQHADDASAPVRVAGLRRDGRLELAHGTYYPSNALAAAAMPDATALGLGGIWVGNSNGILVAITSTNGTTTAMKHLAP